MKKNKKYLSILMLSLMFLLSACGKTHSVGDFQVSENTQTVNENSIPSPVVVDIPSNNYPKEDVTTNVVTPSVTPFIPDDTLIVIDSKDIDTEEIIESTEKIIDTTFNIPEYTGNAWVYINNNIPFFTEEEYTVEPFEIYSDLDYLGRCGVAYANICKEIMPTEERESIGDVKPTGWIQNKYDWVDGKYLYNRCHLIGFQLAGENANPKNLITGTRYLNIDGMLEWENKIANYVKETSNHVLYRVTPIFEGENLLCDGLLMEASSVEDNNLSFCVYAFNVQPNVVIDYKTGNNRAYSTEDYEIIEEEENNILLETNMEEKNYILNTSSNKFHLETCTKLPSDKNRKDVIATREELINAGYSPCGICKP